LLIDLYIPREAPLSDDLERLPRFAESAAPAAICCFFDFAGIQKGFVSHTRCGFIADFTKEQLTEACQSNLCALINTSF